MAEERHKKVTIRMRKIARKKIFAEVVAIKQVRDNPPEWKCCNQCYSSAVDIHKHTSLEHGEEIESKTTSSLEESKTVCSSSKDILEKETADRQDAEHHRPEEPLDQRKTLKQCGSPASTANDRVNQVGANSSGSKREQCSYSEDDVRPWLPMVNKCGAEDEENSCEMKTRTKEGQVLLFYKYIDLEDPEDISKWQRELCRRLQLNGKLIYQSESRRYGTIVTRRLKTTDKSLKEQQRKWRGKQIRIAREGLNGTVGGAITYTEQYMRAVIAHPCFRDMKIEDFKSSSGGRDSFPDGLIVSLHQEIVPMGMDPTQVNFKDAGRHLTPAQFHDEVHRHRNARETGQKTDTVFIDCRNFYESRIGIFPDAVTPDIRKFSYWPEYVDKNEAVFADKKVLMYCTGGIRCERGSAYLRSKGICKEVLQLEGGIHRYLDQYPDGFFRGKLFVFDNRYAIQTNQDVIAECFHCLKPWDEYQPCSSNHCHQLVLSCPSCRSTGLTTCCRRCAELALDYTSREDGKTKKRREECMCTKNRERIPVEKLDNGSPIDSKNKVDVWKPDAGEPSEGSGSSGVS